MNKLTVPEVLPLMHKVYERHYAGCCAHIVTDDANTTDQDAQFCLEQAQKLGHPDCLALCEALVKLSPTQRLKLYMKPRPPFIPERVRGRMTELDYESWRNGSGDK